MVSNKSDAHKTIYDSYDLELASTLIKNVEHENASKNHILSNKIEFDFENDFDKPQLYKQFVADNCKGCSSTSLIDYAYNKIFKKLTTKEDYLKVSDEKIYIDLGRSKGYTSELKKKIARNDNDVRVTINLKTTAVNKNEAKSDMLFSR